MTELPFDRAALLLRPLSHEQQMVVDFIGGAFVDCGGGWPLFD